MGGERGNGPGEKNNRKRGFYSRCFQEGEKVDLEGMLIEGLVTEKAMLRVFTRRLLALGEGIRPLEESANLVGALSMAAIRLAGMLKVQQRIYGDDPGFASALSQAMKQRARE